MARISTPAAKAKSTTRGSSMPRVITAPNIDRGRHRRLGRILPGEVRLTGGRSRSGAGSTCPATGESTRRSRGRRRGLIVLDGLRNRLNPLDEAPALGRVRQRMGDPGRRTPPIPVGALTETVLDRRLTPLEHTAIDLATWRAVRSAETRSCRWSSTPHPRPPPGLGRAPRRGRTARRARSAPAGRRRPRWSCSTALHGDVRPVPADGQP